MANLIRADNGVSSGVTGIVQTADSSGQLALQTTTAGGVATTALTIDNSQNFLVGKTTTSGSAVGTTLFGASGGGGIVTAIQGGGSNTSVFNVVSGSGTETQITFKYSNTSVGSITSTSTGTTLNVGTNGGITFNNSSQGSGTTSSTLNDYEIGTYTATDQSGAGLSFSFARTSVYTKIGNLVNVQIDMTFPSTSNTSTASISLPFTNTNFESGSILTENGGYGSVLITSVNPSNAYFNFLNSATNAGLTNANLSGKRLILNIFYRANF
jgi:hypothetical protein